MLQSGVTLRVAMCNHVVRYKDKDKDKDVYIGPKEFVSHMMMTQTKTKDRLYHQLK